MNITEAQLEDELDRFGPERIRIVAELVHQGTPDGVGTSLILAIGSRETNIANIVGDAGHGRGWLQIDDRFWATWLNTHDPDPLPDLADLPEGRPRGMWLSRPQRAGGFT